MIIAVPLVVIILGVNDGVNHPNIIGIGVVFAKLFRPVIELCQCWIVETHFMQF